MGDGATEKTCQICKQDCSGKPRTKDKRGQYFCTPCYEEARRKLEAKKRARAAQPIASPNPNTEADVFGGGDPFPQTDEPDLLGELLGLNDDTNAPPACTNCGAPMVAGSVICVQCGFNVASGLATTTAVAKAPKKPSKARLKTTGALSSPWAHFLIVVGVIGATMAMIVIAPVFFLIGLGAMVVHGIGVGLWTLVASFTDSILRGLGCMFVPLFVLFWVFGMNENPYLKAHYGAAMVLQIILITVIIGFGASL
ncbi:MAG: hypothetical protein AAF432_00815 [Planctomycetota bacterium]